MTVIRCSHETRLWEALASGQWPQACESELRDHVAACRECSELALVATSINSDRHEAEAVANVPPSGAVWWRMQMRLERESKQAAARTVRRAHSAIVALTVGSLLLVLAMTSLLRAGWSWLVATLPKSGDLAAMMPAAPPLTIVILVSVTLAVITPLALYLAVAEE